MEVVIPVVFLEDTCLQLTIIKTTSQGSFPFNQAVNHTVCLIGDYAQITCSDSLYCIGEPSPLPAILTSSSTTGAFCCESGASGFFVLATGEVPLYIGSVGIDNTFEYRSNHLYCPDTIQFKIDILQSIASQARYNGQPTLTICSASTSFPVADTAILIPGFGSGHFADPSGNVFVMDSLTGLIVIRPFHPNWDEGTLPDSVYWWRLTTRNGQVVASPNLKADEANILQAGGLTIRRK
jgi:hypothetical protein